MRVGGALVSTATLLAALSGLLAAAPRGVDLDRVEIVILHTNDLHGQVLPLKAIWEDPANPPERGGFAALATLIERERAAAKREGKGFLLLDAGDIFQGTPEGNLPEGQLVVSWMKLLRYDCATVGNHELDLGQDAFVRIQRSSDFPWLGGNLRRGRTPLTSTYVLSFDREWRRVGRDHADLKIAIVGLTTGDLKKVSSPRVTEGIEVEPEESSLARALAAHRGEVDVWIALTHCGVETDKRLAARFPELDAIVGGHSHTAIDPSFVDPQTGVLVAQTPGKATNLGRIVLTYDRKARRVVAKRGELIPVRTAAIPPHEPTLGLIAAFEAATPGLSALAERLGEAAAPIQRRSGGAGGPGTPAPLGLGSSPLGNWVTDVMREAVGADVAFHNRTGMRADIPGGPIRRRDLYQVSPFGNTLVAVKLTGAQVRRALEDGLRAPPTLLEVSGLVCRFDPAAPAGARVREVTVGGKPLDPARTYVVVTNSFIAKGGDGHGAFPEGADAVDTGIDLLDAHVEDLKRRTGAGEKVVPDATARLVAVPR